MEEEELKKKAFLELNGYCVDLLYILQNPSETDYARKVRRLLHFLRSCPSIVLQPFLDYTLFPLLLLLDASKGFRSPEYVKSNEFSTKVHGHIKLYNISDAVSEGVLQCLEELLKKCHLCSVDQMFGLLKKLTYGISLSPSQASEEFRDGIIKCFKALLNNLYPCLLESCACKQALGFLALLDDKYMKPQLPELSKFDKEQKECVLAFFQSPVASAVIGHSLSLLLKSAEAEATRGHRGSAKLRIEAFLTFRILVAKVGTADALAFFLPGVVSQLARVLYSSRTINSGAAGSSEVINHAVRGLGEFLMIVLEDDANICELDLFPINANTFHPTKDFSSHWLLEELQHLTIIPEDRRKIGAGNSSNEILESKTVEVAVQAKGSDFGDRVGTLHVNRTKDWLKKSSVHIDKLLSATFPHICVHPAKNVRYGLLASIKGLLSKCTYTLRESRLMLLECLCLLVCDDSEEVSADAQKFLQHLFLSTEKPQMEYDVAELFTRLIGKLQKAMVGSEESLVISQAQQLLAVMYYSGPQLVLEVLLHSPVTAARFLDLFFHCLSQNFVFSGSLDKLVITKPSSLGYLHSLSELKNSLHLSSDNCAVLNSTPHKVLKTADRDISSPMVGTKEAQELPRIPPWFVHIGSQKLYQALAGILRLVGLSMMADIRGEPSLPFITDIPLNYFRSLISEIRTRECSNDGWQSWYSRTGSGRLLRQANTAACILNEMIFGMSDQAVDAFRRMFCKSRKQKEDNQDYNSVCSHESAWRACQKNGRIQLIDCVGSILHEYLSPEVWDLPMGQKSTLEHLNGESDNISLHFLRDTAMLHQVIIDGIGIFSMCLGKDFDTSGFLHSSLYLLLENLSFPNFEIRGAADTVLRILSIACGYPTVGNLVMTNSDYIIDSICRQLRHLNVNRHVPYLLSAMLSYIGASHNILPLLEEPMRCVSLELEILGRHQHPDLTIPFLKAVEEITKASKHEASSILVEAKYYYGHVKSKFSGFEKKNSCQSGLDYNDYLDLTSRESGSADLVNFDMLAKEVEDMLFKLKDSKECRRTVGSIIGSCLAAAIPLLSSRNQSACLIALNIVEDCIATLAEVEAAYNQEKVAKETLVHVMNSKLSHDDQEMMDSFEDDADENRLLPAMNKLWPSLIFCLQSSNPMAIRRCLSTVTTVVEICGGDFFSRRFQTDGPCFWNLLSFSPFPKKPKESRLHLPYRRIPLLPEPSVSEASNLKLQASVLEMMANISRNERSASAFRGAVFRKAAGLAVGIACSGVIGLRDAAMNAVAGLAAVDPDFIWLLVADVYYSFRKGGEVGDLRGLGFRGVYELLPPVKGGDEFLYVRYGGRRFGFEVEFAAAEFVFRKLHATVFASQVHV